MRLYRPSKSEKNNNNNKKKSKSKEFDSVSLSFDPVNGPLGVLQVNDDDGDDQQVDDDDDEDDDGNEIFSCNYDNIELPQPPSLPPSSTSYFNNNTYRYMTCDAFHEILLTTTRTTTSTSNHNNINTHNHHIRTSSFYPGQNVWVCKSKGMKQTKKKKNHITNTNGIDSVVPLQQQQQQQQQRYELFSRAIVVLDHGHDTTANENDHTNHNHNHHTRILVQYPLGSTYHVRSELLLPIFDTPYMKRYMTQPQQEEERELQQPQRNNNNQSPYLVPVVVVYPETHGYRRACLIHTDPIMDHFIEIGCAQGQTCFRIHNHHHHQNQDQRNDNIIHNNSINNIRKRRIVLGIDKSISCIESAQETYGHVSTTTDPLHFVTYDIFQPTLVSSSSLFLSSMLSSTVPPSQNRNESSSCKSDLAAINDNNDVQEIIQCLLDGYNRSIAATFNKSNVVDNVEHIIDHHTDVDHESIDHDLSTSTTKGVVANETESNMGFVIAIDINGNRHLEPILQCLRIIMNTRFTILQQQQPNPHQKHSQPPPQQQPRLIIVKSRSLYLYLQQRPQFGLNVQH